MDKPLARPPIWRRYVAVQRHCPSRSRYRQPGCCSPTPREPRYRVPLNRVTHRHRHGRALRGLHRGARHRGAVHHRLSDYRPGRHGEAGAGGGRRDGQERAEIDHPVQPGAAAPGRGSADHLRADALQVSSTTFWRSSTRSASSRTTSRATRSCSTATPSRPALISRSGGLQLLPEAACRDHRLARCRAASARHPADRQDRRVTSRHRQCRRGCTHGARADGRPVDRAGRGGRPVQAARRGAGAGELRRPLQADRAGGRVLPGPR